MKLTLLAIILALITGLCFWTDYQLNRGDCDDKALFLYDVAQIFNLDCEMRLSRDHVWVAINGREFFPSGDEYRVIEIDELKYYVEQDK